MSIDTALGPRHGPFQDYIEGKSIVIADTSGVARASLAIVLQGLGAKMRQITLVSTFNECVEAIRRIKPQFVVADFEIGKRCGLDLAAEQRQACDDRDSARAFLIVAANTSQSAVARAAEEDVDAYIVRPYSLDGIRKVLNRLATEKLRPAEYSLAIARGKAKLADQRYEEAEREFTHALKLHPTPTLAWYYIGHIKSRRDLHDEAMRAYARGLEFNRIHFKCNVGVYDLHMAVRRYTEAYETIKHIAQIFPANPQRFAEVLRLAIIVARFEDIEPYYQVFCDMEDRDERLVSHICAALVLCGRHYLTRAKTEAAVMAFQRAWATCRGKLSIMREIIQSLLEYNLRAEARALLARVPPAAQVSRDYLISRFLILESEGNLEALLADGHALVTSALADEVVFEIMIRRTYQAGLDAAAESLTMKAIAKFPGKRYRFLEVADLAISLRNGSRRTGTGN